MNWLCGLGTVAWCVLVFVLMFAVGWFWHPFSFRWMRGWIGLSVLAVLTPLAFLLMFQYGRGLYRHCVARRLR